MLNLTACLARKWAEVQILYRPPVQFPYRYFILPTEHDSRVRQSNYLNMNDIITRWFRLPKHQKGFDINYRFTMYPPPNLLSTPLP